MTEFENIMLKIEITLTRDGVTRIQQYLGKDEVAVADLLRLGMLDIARRSIMDKISRSEPK